MTEQIDSPVTVVKYRRHWEDKTHPVLVVLFAVLLAGSIAVLASAVAASSLLLTLSALMLILCHAVFLTLAVKNAIRTGVWVLVEVSEGDPDWTESKVA